MLAAMPVPICRTAQEAYDAGRADALAIPESGQILADLVAEIRSACSDFAAQRPRLLTVTEVGEQLGMGKTAVYELLHRGEFASIEIPSGNGKRPARRVEQSEIDAFIALPVAVR